MPLDLNEKDILEMAEKIRQNEREEIALSDNLHKLLSGDKKLTSRPLVIGKTPNALVICSKLAGIKISCELDLVISKKIIDKAMRPEQRDENNRRTSKSGHFLNELQIGEALRNIKSPVMILKGSRNDSLVAVTELKDDKGQEIIVPIEFNKIGAVGEINNVTSIYGRENFADYIKENVKNNSVIAINKEKANDMLLSIGVDFPKANTLISFDNSISYTTKNVKTLNADVQEKDAAKPKTSDLEKWQNDAEKTIEKLTSKDEYIK